MSPGTFTALSGWTDSGTSRHTFVASFTYDLTNFDLSNKKDGTFPSNCYLQIQTVPVEEKVIDAQYEDSFLRVPRCRRILDDEDFLE